MSDGFAVAHNRERVSYRLLNMISAKFERITLKFEQICDVLGVSGSLLSLAVVVVLVSNGVAVARDLSEIACGWLWMRS